MSHWWLAHAAGSASSQVSAFGWLLYRCGLHIDIGLSVDRDSEQAWLAY
jgi:hypothetical protein